MAVLRACEDPLMSVAAYKGYTSLNTIGSRSDATPSAVAPGVCARTSGNAILPEG